MIVLGVVQFDTFFFGGKIFVISEYFFLDFRGKCCLNKFGLTVLLLTCNLDRTVSMVLGFGWLEDCSRDFWGLLKLEKGRGGGVPRNDLKGQKN
jgi:hypothetical protein